MRKSVLCILICLFAIFGNTICAQKLKCYSSGQTKHWEEVKRTSMPEAEGQIILTIFPDSLRQRVDGFGGTFNELGWDAMQVLPANKQKEVLQSLFGQNGIRFSYARIPMGASDYALSYYSYCDVKEDFSMRDFNIDRDRYILIPYIKEALKLRPDLKIWASPWTPPAWMKINEHYSLRGGNMNNRVGGNEMDIRKNVINNATAFNMQFGYLQAYALYFSKYIREYAKAGVNIWAVMPQNEIAWSPNWPCCTWCPEDMGNFIGKYLGPQLKKDSLNTQIWLGTINFPNPDYVRTVLKDKDALSYLSGVGFQWSGGQALPSIYRENPQMSYMQTENTCGDHENDWSSLENSWKNVLHYFNNGVNIFMYWNMVLDETGKSSWGWAQNSLVRINRTSGQIIYTDEYYLMKHLSHFVQPGSHLLKISGYQNALAFLTHTGQMAIVIYNPDKSKNCHLKIKNTKYSAFLPEKSITTLIVNDLL